MHQYPLSEYNCTTTDEEFICEMESLPVYLTTIKSGRTQLVNGVKQLHKRLQTLKSFKGRTELYSPEVFDYYDPFLEIQETLLASLRASGIIRSTAFSMSLDQADRKSDLSNMIKTPMKFVEELHHRKYEEHIGDNELEWMAAEDIDFESIHPHLKHLSK